MKLLEGTPQEIAEYQRITGQVPTAQRAVGATTASGGNLQIWNEATANAFWRSLDPNRNGGMQKKLLRFMIKKEDGRATPDELLKYLKINNKVLRGPLANITRNARRETGYDKALVVEWATDRGGYYYIPEPLLALLKQID